MTRKEAEARALELYPPDLVAYGLATEDDNDLIFDNNDASRKAYLQCWEDMQDQPKETLDTLITYKNELSQMFDSPSRIGMAIYDEISKIEKALGQ